jgi:glyoxylase-like metal-dependent hydrolase (beta-lactamase superfamily II)
MLALAPGPSVAQTTHTRSEMYEATDSQPAQYSRTVGSVSILQVRPDIYMLTVEGVNIAVETGQVGTVVVDTGPADVGSQVLAAVRTVTDTPIRYLINTSADPERIGGNQVLADAGHAFIRGALGYVTPIIAHQNVVLRILKDDRHYAPEALPNDTFTRLFDNLSINGQAMQVMWQPAAHTDGDAMVMFRRSDVVITGAIFDQTHFPVIDLMHGGSVAGEIAALNRLLDQMVVAVLPQATLPGGTLVIPARGPLCNIGDVVNYRDMVSIIRDRIQALMRQGRSLSQIEATDPARDYATRYGSDTGDWTTRQFVEAIYRSLADDKVRLARKGG